MSAEKLAMVVDNDKGWREIYSGVLQQEGYEVEVFKSDKEAIKYMQDHRPNVAIVHFKEDMRRSLSFIAKCSGLDSSISILYSTFYKGPDLRQRAIKAGAFAVLDKEALSFDRADFGRTLDRAYNQSLARRQHQSGGPNVFVLMPFAKQFDKRYLLGIKEPLEAVKIRCERVDHVVFSGNIMEKLFQCIRDATVIVADMTGRNPNVFYEVGYAHALQKSVILLMEKPEEIPFDLKHQKHIIYGRSIERLRTELLKAVSASIKGRGARAKSASASPRRLSATRS